MTHLSIVSWPALSNGLSLSLITAVVLTNCIGLAMLLFLPITNNQVPLPGDETLCNFVAGCDI